MPHFVVTSGLDKRQRELISEMPHQEVVALVYPHLRARAESSQFPEECHKVLSVGPIEPCPRPLVVFFFDLAHMQEIRPPAFCCRGFWPNGPTSLQSCTFGQLMSLEDAYEDSLMILFPNDFFNYTDILRSFATTYRQDE